MDWNDLDAALFDLDGVLTPTADVHRHAWAEMFTAFLTDHPDAAPYTDDDYFTYVDGKPRYDGVRAFLASRGLDAPDDLVTELGDRKNEVFAAVLERDGVDPYPGSLALVEALAARGTAVAVVSSSRNAEAVLRAADLIDYFEVIMHGGLAEERGLPGKPAPDTFLAAAADLGVEPDRAVVFEDATSGVEAGAAGGFALVVGVDRGVGADALLNAGADKVVTDLAEVLP